MCRKLLVCGVCLLLVFLEVLEDSTWTSTANASPNRNSLVIATALEPPSLLPLGCCFEFVQLGLINLMFTSLTYFDRHGQLQPGLATELPTLENGRLRIAYDETGKFISQEVRWTLRDEATWSDGVPVSCADAQFGYEVAIAPEGLYEGGAPNADRVERVDCPAGPEGKDILIRYKRPHIAWASPWGHGLQTFGPLSPSHIWKPIWEETKRQAQMNPDNIIDLNLEFWALASATGSSEAFVGNGPFVFEEWQPGQFLRFSRRQDYFLKPPGPEENYLQEIIVRFIPNSDAQLAGLLGGELDANDYSFFGYDPKVLQLNFGDRATVEAKPQGAVEFLTFNQYPNMKGRTTDEFNCTVPEDLLLTDVRTRRAVIQAIDREELIRAVLPGSLLTHSYMPQGDLGYNPNLKHWRYDPDAARALFAELGWADADNNGVLERTTADGRVVEFRLEYLSTPDLYRVASSEVLQSMLAEVGIALEPVVHRPFTVYDFDLEGFNCRWSGVIQTEAQGGWSQAPHDVTTHQLYANDYFEDPVDPVLENVSMPSTIVGENIWGWINDEFDRLVGDAYRELDPVKRVPILMRMQEIFNEELPRIPLAERVFVLVKKAGLVNYLEGETPISVFVHWNAWEWGWEQNGAVLAP